MSLCEPEMDKNQHQTHEGAHSLGAAHISQNSSRNRVASQFTRGWRVYPETPSGGHQFKCHPRKVQFLRVLLNTEQQTIKYLKRK